MRCANSLEAAAAWVEKVVSWFLRGRIAEERERAERHRYVSWGQDVLVMDGNVSVSGIYVSGGRDRKRVREVIYELNKILKSCL